MRAQPFQHIPNTAGDAGPARVRIVIVTGQPLLRWALWNITEATGDLLPVGEAADPRAAFDLVDSLCPDVVAIDCSTPNGDGWRVARDLRDRHDGLGIVVVAPDGSDDVLFRALDTGASAYVGQTATIPEIVSALRHAAVAASSFSAVGLAQAMRRRHEAQERMALSPREREVLRLLRDGKSVPEVAATIYVSLSTAKTYVARIYQKLGATNRAQALMTAVELGLFSEVSESIAI